MSKIDLVSVIIPCYNYAQYLEEAIQSVLKQTYPNIEIIIINDGSPDNTEEIALKFYEKYPERIIFVNQDNQGVSKARNNGIAKSSGSYILPFDADDVMDSNMVDRCMETIKSTQSDIVYTGYRRIGIMGGSNKGKPFSENNFLFIAPHGVVALYKRSVWEKTGGYKNNMKGSYEDWEFWVNAYTHSFKFYHLAEILFSYRKKEVSGWTHAYGQHDYAKSKIIMNHPELYLKYQVEDAITIIQEKEKLSGIYFYYDEYMPKEQKRWITALGEYLDHNTLEKDQIVTLIGKKIGLFLLDTLEDKSSVHNLYKNNNVDFILFYTYMRYEILTLKTSDFSWEKGKGIIECHGTIFPFVFKSIREDLNLQRIAYDRLRNYQEQLPNDLEKQIKHWQKESIPMHKQKLLIDSQDDLLEKRKVFIHDQADLLEKRKALIHGQTDLLEKRKVLIHGQTDLLEKRKVLIHGQTDLLGKRKVLIHGQADLLEKRKALIHGQVDLLEKRKVLIHGQADLLEKRKALIHDQSDLLKKQGQFIKIIENFIEISIFKRPIQKYKAYKYLLIQFYKLKQ